jgi:hypothetical protein
MNLNPFPFVFSVNISRLWIICKFKILNKLKIGKNGVNVKKKRLDFIGTK